MWVCGMVPRQGQEVERTRWTERLQRQLASRRQELEEHRCCPAEWRRSFSASSHSHLGTESVRLTVQDDEDVKWYTTHTLLLAVSTSASFTTDSTAYIAQTIVRTNE